MIYIKDNIGLDLPEKNLARSPLQYPGGKSKAVRQICALIPRDTKELISPFLGGAWVELALDQIGVKVYGFDFFQPVVDFWQEAIHDAEYLSRVVRNMWLLPTTVEDFKAAQGMKFGNIVDRAAQFYYLNRASFSGRGFSGSMCKKQKGYKESNREFLSKFKVNHMRVYFQDFRDTINRNGDDIFMYLDPPYAIGKNSQYYGVDGDMHDEFPHEELVALLKKKKNWLMSYNNSEYIYDLFKDFRIVVPDGWSYGMSPGAEKSREVFILGDGIPEVIVEEN